MKTFKLLFTFILAIVLLSSNAYAASGNAFLRKIWDGHSGIPHSIAIDCNHFDEKLQIAIGELPESEVVEMTDDFFSSLHEQLNYLNSIWLTTITKAWFQFDYKNGQRPLARVNAFYGLVELYEAIGAIVYTLENADIFELMVFADDLERLAKREVINHAGMFLFIRIIEEERNLGILTPPAKRQFITQIHKNPLFIALVIEEGYRRIDVDDALNIIAEAIADLDAGKEPVTVFDEFSYKIICFDEDPGECDDWREL